MNPPTRHARRVVGAPRSVYRPMSDGAQPPQRLMGMRLATLLGERNLWNWLVPATIVGGLLLGVMAFIAPRIGMLVLFGLLLLAIWRWVRVELAVEDLAAQLARGETLNKQEVGQGAWGALCQGVNKLVQQQRLVQRSQSLLPSLPPDVMNGLLDGRISTDQTPQAATVLLVGYQTAHQGRKADLHWETLAALAQTVAAPHGALVQRCGDRLLLVFGLGRQSLATPGLRSALHTALALRAQWQTRHADCGPLTMALTAGPLLAGAVDGLGYGVVGQPIAQAQTLYGLAAAHGENTMLCNEETYVGLLQLGVEGKPLQSWGVRQEPAAYVIEMRGF